MSGKRFVKPAATDFLEIDDPVSSRLLEPLKPAKPCALPIVAVRPDHSVVCEGEVFSTHARMAFFDEYCELLPTLPRHMLVTFSSDSWLWKLNERWQNHPRWTWAVMVQRKPRAKMRQHVSYYGFRPPKGRRRESFTNLVLDAGSFTGDTDADLMELGLWVRAFCNKHGLRLRSSAAGVAAQLLRHPNFYPEARRIVPAFINETAREHLPGPFYESYTDSAQRIDAAMYIDQEAAYHYAAQVTPLPNANSIRATGYAHHNAVYAREGGEMFDRELRKHGLVHAEVFVPPIRAKALRFLPRALRKPGHQRAWLWTNEIPYLRSQGLRILGLLSVWGTAEVDDGIRKYATWAREISRANPHLKALLLMPYGALGRRPATIELHSPSHGPDRTRDSAFLLAGRVMEGTRQHDVDVQTYTANALQLGLIQAHVRALSLDMARQLSAKGEEVISVYADGIFIRLDDKRQVPMFAPWRLKEDSLELHLTDSLRVPVREAVRREYVAAEVAANSYMEGT